MTTEPRSPDPANDVRSATAQTDPDELAARRAEIAARYIRPADERRSSTGRGVHHLALLCSDVERTVRFYDGVLGFPLVEVIENRDYPGSTHFFLDIGGGNLLAFFDFPGLDLGGYAEVLGGLHHVAVSVTRERWEAVRAGLERDGVSHAVHADSSLYLSDPDGVRLELIAGPAGGS
jgi:catechol 2,3-dioxygenase-like lactoylglutathione lyase family enzyme